MKKVLLLDLDNTLYDYNSAHKLALKDVHQSFCNELSIDFWQFEKLYNSAKFEIHRELVGTASSHNRAIYFQRVIEKTHEDLRPDIVLDLYDTYWKKFFECMKIYSGVEDVLIKFKKSGYKIGIVTNFTTQIQLRKIQKLKISDYIDVLVSSEEAGSEKPHPAAFLMILNKLNVLPQDAIMVGDNMVDDIEWANYLGITTVLLSQKVDLWKVEIAIQKPDLVIGEFAEIERLLEV